MIELTSPVANVSPPAALLSRRPVIRAAWRASAIGRTHLLTLLSGVAATVAGVKSLSGVTLFSGFVLAAGGVGAVVGSARILSVSRGQRRFLDALAPMLTTVTDDGDLSKRIPRQTTGLGTVAAHFNDFLDRLNQFVWLTDTASRTLEEIAGRLAGSSSHALGVSSQMATAMAQLASGSNAQAETVTSASIEVHDLRLAAEQVNGNAQSSAASATEAVSLAAAGQRQLAEALTKVQALSASIDATSDVVQRLGHLGEQIDGIVAMIGNLAAQTNLLALNAAIEAARAGDQGRGFMVVAEEVRQLASRSAACVESITAMVREIQGSTGAVVSAMVLANTDVQAGTSMLAGCADTFGAIVAEVARSSREATAIMTTVEALTSGLQRVASGMSAMTAQAQQMAASNQELAASAEEQMAIVSEVATVSNVVDALAQDMRRMSDGYRTACAVWADKFVSHLTQVDEQHQQIFEAINRFGDAVRTQAGFAAIGRTLEALHQCTESHFREEEALMRRYGYPDLASHQVMHVTFLKRIRALQADVHRGDSRSVLNAARLCADWLSSHILHVDLQGYVPFIHAAQKRGR